MKKHIFLFFILIAFATSSFDFYKNEHQRIGFIDIDEALFSTKVYKAAQEKIKLNQLSTNQKEEQVRNEIQEFYDSVQKVMNYSCFNGNDFEPFKNSVQKRFENLRAKRQSTLKRHEDFKDSLTSDAYKFLHQQLQLFAKKHRITHIINKTDILYGHDDLNFTPHFKAFLNADTIPVFKTQHTIELAILHPDTAIFRMKSYQRMLQEVSNIIDIHSDKMKKLKHEILQLMGNYEGKVRLLAQKQEEYQALQQEIVKINLSKEQELIQPILVQFKDVVQRFAQKHDYAIVFTQKDGFNVENFTDCTQQVKDLIFELGI